VIEHAGRLLSLVECCLPLEVDSELATIGAFDFDGQVDTPMTAHPKRCPLTGELHFFGYDFAPPHLTYHVADATGTLITSRVVDVPGATMMHDFNLTEQFVVFMDLPAVFDLELAAAGTVPYRYDPAYGARLGVLRRDDPYGVVRWFRHRPLLRAR
jgi:carotenoid cleavage dioxygenase